MEKERPDALEMAEKDYESKEKERKK